MMTPTNNGTQSTMNHVFLFREQWQQQSDRYTAEAAPLIEPYLMRRRTGGKHPIFDFLVDYYPVKLTHLTRWHPGVGVTLQGPAPHCEWPGYTTCPHTGSVAADVAGLWLKRGHDFLKIRELLQRSATNLTHFNCFGLHEWAMVYRSKNIRHDLPLRLSREETDRVVDNHQLVCTHVDAYRFFTPAAKPLNLTVLTREKQQDTDQCGCLHVTMDLYKWAAKLEPLVPSPVWLDIFRLAEKARILDMEASPYDCRELGFGAVAIETPAGKAEYVNRQRAIAAESVPLREKLISIISAAETCGRAVFKDGGQPLHWEEQPPVFSRQEQRTV